MKICKYDKEVRPRMQYIIKWAELGMTNEQIAKALHIARSTFQKYAADYPEFKNALSGAKEVADEQMVSALFKSGIGHYVTVKKPMKVKEAEFDCDGKKVHEVEKVIFVPEEQYIAPVTLAQLAWLKNRRPDEWNDKITVQHQGGVALSIEDIVRDSEGAEW